uniref:N-acetyltransferase domain-containing protein n=1 Tax=Rhabditophanes sp. KR3021 TaxID=114890 RepID=A0AC35U3I8_9BILA
MAAEEVKSFPGLPKSLINYRNFDKKTFNKFADLVEESERWSYCLQYFDILYKSFGEEGMVFITAVEEETKKPMGCIVGTFWKNQKGEKALFTIGTFFIIAEYRGKGLGNYLFDTLYREGLKYNIPLYLCSVAKMSQKYCEKYGFNLFRDYKCTAYSPKCTDFVKKTDISLPTHKVWNHTEFAEWDKLLQFDLQLSNGVVDRLNYLKNWFDGSLYTGIVTNEKDQVVGYASVQECLNNVLSVGPLYAESKDVVHLLVNKILENVDLTKYTELRFKAFTCNTDIKDLLIEYTDGNINYLADCTLQFAISSIPTEEKYLHCIVDLAQNFI